MGEAIPIPVLGKLVELTVTKALFVKAAGVTRTKLVLEGPAKLKLVDNKAGDVIDELIVLGKPSPLVTLVIDSSGAVDDGTGVLRTFKLALCMLTDGSVVEAVVGATSPVEIRVMESSGGVIEYDEVVSKVMVEGPIVVELGTTKKLVTRVTENSGGVIENVDEGTLGVTAICGLDIDIDVDSEVKLGIVNVTELGLGKTKLLVTRVTESSGNVVEIDVDGGAGVETLRILGEMLEMLGEMLRMPDEMLEIADANGTFGPLRVRLVVDIDGAPACCGVVPGLAEAKAGGV